MKKLIMLIIMLLIFCNHLYAEVRKNVAYTEIKNVYLFAAKDLGAINSYAIFYDNNGNPCSTNGTISLYIKRTTDETRAVVAPNALSTNKIVVPVERKRLIKNIQFNPDNFQYLNLLRGNTVFALPINLNSNEMQSGDILILEWWTFTVEQKIY